MRRKNIIMILFALILALMIPGMVAEAKTKLKLTTEKKTMTVGQTYKLQLKGVSGKANVKWKTSKKTVVSIAKKNGNTVTLKAKKKGAAVVTAVYKKKQYKCRITVKEKNKTAADNPALSSKSVTLYYLSNTYKNYIKYDRSHRREYRFRVSGTKKKVKEWKITGKGADYFSITDYGLLQMEGEPTYIEPCVTAKVTAILEDGRKLTAAVKAYSELNIYMDTVFTDFEKKYTTSSMTEKEKAEKAAWYISTISDYDLYNDNWFDIFLKGKGDCYASRYAVQYMCSHMGIKALVCRNYEAHGQTLVFADGRFYLIITGYNEPKPRRYTMYEISGEALEELAKDNLIDLNYFYK